MRKIIFELYMAPGDCLVFTSALRDLHLNYPGEFTTDVHSYYSDLFNGNDYITPLLKSNGSEAPEVKRISDSDIIMNRNGSHYSLIYNYIISDFLGVEVPQMSIFPELFLNEEERSERILKRLKIKKPFWIINSSFKIDIPLKQWPTFYWHISIRKRLIQPS